MVATFKTAAMSLAVAMIVSTSGCTSTGHTRPGDTSFGEAVVVTMAVVAVGVLVGAAAFADGYNSGHHYHHNHQPVIVVDPVPYSPIVWPKEYQCRPRGDGFRCEEY